MGTNYYIGRLDGSHEDNQTTHVGKSSMGWVFQFQGSVCRSLKDWEERLDNLPGECAIVSENGVVLERQEFIQMITGTLGAPRTMRRYALDLPYDNFERIAIANRSLEGSHWEDGGFDFCNYEFC